MAPFYELDVDQRGSVIPESERRLKPGDEVVLASEGENEYRVSAKVLDERCVEVRIRDKRTPGDVYLLEQSGQGHLGWDDLEYEEPIDGQQRDIHLYQKGVCVWKRDSEHPEKIIEWKEDPREREEFLKKYPISGRTLRLVGETGDWLRSEERFWPCCAKCLAAAFFVIPEALTISLIAYPFETLVDFSRKKWREARGRGSSSF